jgi:hypothetical protein
MKTKIRKSVFETNSSSMHSICISGGDNFVNYGQLRGHFDEYGWGYDRLDSVGEKLSYVLTSMRYHDYDIEEDSVETLLNSKFYIWLNEMIKDYTGEEIDLEYSNSGYYSMGYVDHQSTDLLDEYWSDDETTFKENMKELIFNSKYDIIIDNDNH